MFQNCRMNIHVADETNIQFPRDFTATREFASHHEIPPHNKRDRSMFRSHPSVASS